jgi:hypothetical protein
MRACADGGGGWEQRGKDAAGQDMRIFELQVSEQEASVGSE